MGGNGMVLDALLRGSKKQFWVRHFRQAYRAGTAYLAA